MSKQTTILLIDDDEDDRWLFEEALRRTAPKVKCITAAGGLEAIAFLNHSEVLPDLIFLDLNMPGMDGKKCLSLLKQNEKLASITVIVYTTSDFYKDRDDAMRLGASEFIIKPADYKELCVILQDRFSQQ